MRTRVLIVSAAVLALPYSASGEPSKTPQTRPEARTAPVILASADQPASVRGLPISAASTPVKRPRAARVTTCRCGGDPQPQEQERP